MSRPRGGRRFGSRSCQRSNEIESDRSGAWAAGVETAGCERPGSRSDRAGASIGVLSTDLSRNGEWRCSGSSRFKIREEVWWIRQVARASGEANADASYAVPSGLSALNGLRREMRHRAPEDLGARIVPAIGYKHSNYAGTTQHT